MDANRITGEAKKVGGKVEGAIGDITGDGDRETQVEGRATELKGSVENLYGQAKDALIDVIDHASETAGDALADARQRFPQAERAMRSGGATIEQYGKESPVLLALMAGALGYVLSLLIHRR